MNFRNRCDILRSDIVSDTDGLATRRTVSVQTEAACTFTVMSAAQVAEVWPGGSAMDLTTTRAILRLPVTFQDLPEPGHALNDYSFKITSPDVGYVKQDSGAWAIEAKRYAGRSVEYMLRR